MNDKQSIDCFVCRKHMGDVLVPGGPIFEDDLFYIAHSTLFGDEKQHYLGHVFIETKRHIAEIADMNEQEAGLLGVHSQRVAQALLSILPMEHVYSFIIGDGVPHLHIHLIGRYQGAPKPYWGPRVDEWPDAPKGGNEEIAALNQRLRNYFGMNNW